MIKNKLNINIKRVKTIYFFLLYFLLIHLNYISYFEDYLEKLLNITKLDCYIN